jgi:hypothetical protein
MQKRNVDLVNNRRQRRNRFCRLLITGLAIYCSLLAKVTGAQEDQLLPPGMYRLEMIMASTTRIPFFGTSKSASKSVSLVEIRRDGSGIIQNHRVCDFRVVEESAIITMVFPEKFIAALAQHSYPIQLEKDAQGWSYRADLGMERIGYRTNGLDEKLPARIDDAAVFDWDGDGHPGATLKLSVPLLPAGELYIVQRGQSLLTGRVIQPGRIEGGIEVRQFDQRVLGARPGFLARSPEIEPNAKDSRFSLSQIAADSTCESLRSASRKP